MAKLADSIQLPKRANVKSTAAPGRPVGPKLVRGRGLDRRKPRGLASRVLLPVACLIVALGLVLLAVL